MGSQSISKSVTWQLIGKIILQGVAFFTTPIFTRILSTSDYGYVALYTSWVSILVIFIGFQSNGSIQNGLKEYGKDKLDSYCSSILTISLLSFLFFLVITIIFNDFFSKILGLQKDLVILMVLQSFATFVILFRVNTFDALKLVEKSTILSTVQTISAIILSLLFVILLPGNKGVNKIYGQAIVLIAIAIFIVIKIYVKGKTFFNKEYNKYCILLTAPLIMHGLGHLVFSQSDRIMIEKLIGSSELGIYSVVLSLASVLSIIFGALNSAWVPFYYDYKSEHKEKDIIEHSKRYLKLYTGITIGFALLSYDVYKLLAPPEFYAGMTLIPFFVISMYFNYLYLFPVNAEFYYEKTKIIPIATIIAAVINIVVNYLLIPVFGIKGAAIGTMVAHILLFIIHWIFAKVLLKDKFEYKLPLLLFYLFILLVAVFIVLVIKDLIIIRWISAVILGFFILKDIIKNRSIF